MKKNAFTLIEMIATIGLLGMLATITITVSVRKINETKEKAREAMIESIELAAKKYVNENEIIQFDNYDNVYITLQTLVEKEYFTESLVDPTTKKNIPLTNEIYITREENGEIKSYYNLNQRKESKLTLIGPYNEYVEVGKDYQELGVTAINPNKEDVSSNVTITGTVDTTTPNTYKITYELDNVKITRNVIVYENNLSSKEFYKLIVDLDGGTDTVDYNIKYEAGSIITLTEPTKEGYIFAGWTVSGTGANIKENILTIGKTLTKVTAKWEEVIITVSFKEDSWETIVTAVELGNHPYEVGDTKEVNLGETLGTHTLRVANTTPCEGLSITSKTACGFVLEFADIITTRGMNTTESNIGGWPASSQRTYINSTIYNALPSDLKNGIIDTYVISSNADDDLSGTLNGNFESTDKLYLLSPQEVYGTSFTTSNDRSNGTSRQLDYYENNGVTSTSNKSIAIKKSGTTATWWWTRSAHEDYTYAFFVVKDTGSYDNSNAANSGVGVSPAFRLSN